MQTTKQYTFYAAEHGLDPDAMLEKDKEDWPGGCMTGFMLWTQKRKAAFYKAKAWPRDKIMDTADQDAFRAHMEGR